MDTARSFGALRVRWIATGRWRENCYLVHHAPTGEQLLIDPGGDAADVARLVEDEGEGLKHILLTHGHYDHVGACAALSKRYGVPCRLHAADRRLLLHAPMYGLRWDRKRVEPITSYVTFAEDPDVELGGQRVMTFGCPGHTKGGVAYGFGAFVFTGDTLLHEQVGRTDLPGGDEEALRGSVDRLLTDLSPEVVLFGGHGPPWTVEQAQAWWRAVDGPLPRFDMQVG